MCKMSEADGDLKQNCVRDMQVHDDDNDDDNSSNAIVQSQSDARWSPSLIGRGMRHRNDVARDRLL